ncbi:ATP-grasp domain-containing protein [Methylophaga sp.]|uniref:ATP-grasp domain-containing protein n=1 Tax=Methylophaga sp. TaxID=2024840 RepID=UPI003A8F2260
MTIFIYEHFTSGALSETVFSAGLMHEGELMLASICQDLQAYNHHIAIMRDERLPALPFSTERITTYPIQTKKQFNQTWLQCQQRYDLFLIIAPETDLILFDLIQSLEQQSKTILNCRTEAILLCADKYRTYQQFKAYQIKTPVTFTADEWLCKDHHDHHQWVLKPIDGAGCEDTYVYNSIDARHQLLTLNKDRFIVQPYIYGDSLSLSLFMTGEKSHLLSVNIQHVKKHQQQLHLDAFEAQRFDMLSIEKAQEIAEQIRMAIPGLWGFVGVDLIKTDNVIYVVEVNPRLTTTYAEPAMRSQTNPARLLNTHIQALNHDNTN